MNWQSVLEYFVNILSRANIAVVNAGNYSLPNIVFDIAGKYLWLELGIEPVKHVLHTESVSKYSLDILCRVCSPVNSGTTAANQTASEIAACFSPASPDKAVFTLSSNRTLYVQKVEQTAGTITGSVYKTELKIGCELYVNEEEE